MFWKENIRASKSKRARAKRKGAREKKGKSERVREDNVNEVVAVLNLGDYSREFSVTQGVCWCHYMRMVWGRVEHGSLATLQPSYSADVKS
jgi:hypothetical protein